jgi:hypothetical protein
MFNYLKLGVLFFLICTLLGCERDFAFKGGSEGLYFSVDTVRFDTIFTSIGSTTKHFKVFNPYDSDLTIDDIRLAGGSESMFRLNINGFPENSLKDLPLRSGDSLFIFVELTVEPTGSNAPIVVSDSILFYTKDHLQSVKLVAYGQDVILLRKETLKTQRFTKDKPYLIYDYLVVDSAETLTIEAGSKLHFYKSASLIVLGSLHVEGTKDAPVTFTGARLEDWYAEIPGQWDAIYLMPGSTNHLVNHAIIRNGTHGLVVDSIGIDGAEPLHLSNSRIEHITKQGLLAQTSSIITSNCVFGYCGGASVALTVGGNYEFYHCTIANYFNWAYRSEPALLLSNYFQDESGNFHTKNLNEALFSNCIIYGRANNEIILDFKQSDAPNNNVVKYRFDHSLIRTNASSVALSNNSNYRDVIINKDSNFIDAFNSKFQLDTLSVAKDYGDKVVGLRFPFDIMGNSRIDDDGPDVGAFERIEKK